MSTRDLDSTLTTAIEQPVVYPALLFDLTFGGYAPPFTIPEGQAISWSLPTTVGTGDQNYPSAPSSGNGSAVGSLTGGTLTMTSSGGLGNWFWVAQWGGFSAPTIPDGATVTGIYPVIICSHAINSTLGNAESQAMAGVDVSPTSIEIGGELSIPGGSFASAAYYGASLGTDLSALSSYSIAARLFATLGQSSFDDVLSVTGVGFAIYYEGSPSAGVEPQPDGGNTYHIWSGIGTLVVNGTSYLGVGSLGGVSTMAEGIGVEAKGITLTLSGIDPAWLSMSMTEINLASRAKVWLAFLNPAATSTSTLVIDSPIRVFTGIMDGPQIDMDTKSATIAIDVESKMVDLNRSRGGRLTDQDQQVRYPGDNSLQYCSYNQDACLIWKQ